MQKIVLAYSGGLDTSVIVHWLQENYQSEIISYTANLGQNEDFKSIEEKAKAANIKQIVCEELSEDFVRDYVFPMLRANPLYEGEYLLGTSIARPLIAKRLVKVAQASGATSIAHGATGKGNDQVRFELSIAALDSSLKVIAPWRLWDFTSRQDLMNYAHQHRIPIDLPKQNKKTPYSIDANLLHTSYEGDELEDPWQPPSESMWQNTASIETTPDAANFIDLSFVKGDATAINNKELSPAELLKALNEIGGLHGIGRVDMVENRFVGMKSRGCYETPGGSILLKAHRALESLTLDRETFHLKDELMPRYTKLIYNGFWFAPERKALQAAIDHTQQTVTGDVRLKLYKGNIIVQGRRSPFSLYNEEIATFEDDQGAYDQRDAAGFIRLNALRLQASAQQKKPK